MDKEFFEKLLAGDKLTTTRAITAVENETPAAKEILRAVYPHTGGAYRIGITGPPGAGKSTLANKLALHYRRGGIRVGIIAVDPTSPYTGGALLGDRVRMSDVELDEGVFVRSMASRGSAGGLSRKTAEAADVLDASGKEIILLETVGVGQSELDIAAAADTTVVVLVPESGDSIQAMKSGLMEIADVFVLNKSDRAGADQAVMAIKTILQFKPQQDGPTDRAVRASWNPEVVKAVASGGKGIDEAAAIIERHRRYQEETGRLREKRLQRLVNRIRELVGEQLHVDFWNEERMVRMHEQVRRVIERKLTPYDVVEEFLNEFRANETEGRS